MIKAINRAHSCFGWKCGHSFWQTGHPSSQASLHLCWVIWSCWFSFLIWLLDTGDISFASLTAPWCTLKPGYRCNPVCNMKRFKYTGVCFISADDLGWAKCHYWKTMWHVHCDHIFEKKKRRIIFVIVNSSEAEPLNSNLDWWLVLTDQESGKNRKTWDSSDWFTCDSFTCWLVVTPCIQHQWAELFSSPVTCLQPFNKWNQIQSQVFKWAVY